MDITIKEMAEKLRMHDEYRIIYHKRPDGDCIGSAFALCLALQRIGKRCDVTGTDPVPKMHRPLTDRVSLDAVTEPVYIAVDCANTSRTATFADTHFTFCIDHHNNTFHSADFRYVEKDCGACTEIILKIIKAMEVPVTPLMADLLYTGLVTDTYCFRTTDTSAQSFETAAELVRLGADIYTVGRRTMFTKSKGRLAVENKLRGSFRFGCDDRIVSGCIMLSDLAAAGVADSDLEGINSMVEEPEGIRVGITVRELADGTMRCSVRTNGDISADAICREHGGGGHFHAACCELDADAETARSIMETTARKFLEEE